MKNPCLITYNDAAYVEEYNFGLATHFRVDALEDVFHWLVLRQHSYEMICCRRGWFDFRCYKAIRSVVGSRTVWLLFMGGREARPDALPERHLEALPDLGSFG